MNAGDATVAAVLAHAEAQPPLLGGGRLVCIDGPAGAGKTTLSAAVADAARGHLERVEVLHTDDLLQGWDGLPALGPRLRNYVIGPLASGHPALYRRYDWVAGRFAELHVIEPPDLLVVEGVGSGSGHLRSRRATLVFVSAPPELRLVRGIERDGEGMREHWLRWMDDEQQEFLRNGTSWSADLYVDEVGRLLASGS